MTKKAAAQGGKLNANRPLGNGPECREHGTRWRTGAIGVLTPDAVRQFAAQGMTLTQIGYLVGCTKSHIHGALKDPELNQAWCEGLASFIEESTGCLLHNIREKNVLSAMFALKCRHLPGEKGWLEEQYQQKVVDEENQPRVSIYLPYNGRDPAPSELISEEESFSVQSGSGD